MTRWLGGLLGRRRRRFPWPMALTQADVAGRGLARGVQVVRLRSLRVTDRQTWQRLQLGEDDRLAPWEATLPPGSGEVLPAFTRHVHRQNRSARRGEAMSLVVEVDGDFAGQIAVAPIVWGPLRSACLGYWIGSAWEGRGVMALAVAMVLDELLGPEVGLHRAEINVRPDNARSCALCERLGLRDEGLRRGLMHGRDGWADHRSYAVVAEDPVAVTGFVARLEQSATQRGDDS